MGQVAWKTHITVFNSDREEITDAVVTIESEDYPEAVIPFNDDHQKYVGPKPETGDFQVKIEHPDYLDEVFTIHRLQSTVVYLMLGRPGELYYWQKGRKTYFQPQPNTIGLTLDPETEADPQKMDAFTSLAERLGLELLRKIYPSSDPYKSSDYFIVIWEYHFEPQKDDPSKGKNILRALRMSPLVRCAGPKLGERAILRNEIHCEVGHDALDWLDQKGYRYSRVSASSPYLYNIELDEDIGLELLDMATEMQESTLFKEVTPTMCLVPLE